MEGKFLGLGLKNAVGLFFLFMIFSLILKVIFAMHHVEGVSEVVMAGA